jgi:hypothetical protein
MNKLLEFLERLGNAMQDGEIERKKYNDYFHLRHGIASAGKTAKRTIIY